MPKERSIVGRGRESRRDEWMGSRCCWCVNMDAFYIGAGVSALFHLCFERPTSHYVSALV